MNSYVRSKEKKQDYMKEGFSLIEVIIAIALLGVIVMPILGYFSNAAVTTSRGKDVQRASTAAESVIEELNAFNSLEQLEEYMQSREGDSGWDWSITPAESTTVQPGKKTSTILKNENIEIDGVAYKAKVELQYDYSTGTAGYNNPNQKPLYELKEVYSASNAVITEGDQLDRATSHFLLEYPNMTAEEQNNLTKNIERELRLDITETDGVYTIEGAYHYTYNGESYDAVVTRTKAENLADVYFFYNPSPYAVLSSHNENVKVSISRAGGATADAELENKVRTMNIYFVCQTSNPVTAPQLTFSTAHMADKAVYHTNVTTYGVPRKEMVASDTKKRIAKVIVDIYDSTDADMSGDSLVRMESSKGE